MDPAPLLSLLLGGFALIVGGLLYLTWRSRKLARQAREQFAEIHRLRLHPTLPRQPWQDGGSLLTSLDDLEDVIEGTVRDVPVVICSARGHRQTDNDRRASTVAVVPLEGTRFPDCHVLPAQLGKLLGPMLQMLGGELGVDIIACPQLPNHTVFSQSGQGIDAALGECNLHTIAELDPPQFAVNDGWLIVHPARRRRGLDLGVTRVETLQTLLDTTLALKQRIEAV